MKFVFTNPTHIEGRQFPAGSPAGEVNLAPGVPIDRFASGLRTGLIIDAAEHAANNPPAPEAAPAPTPTTKATK